MTDADRKLTQAWNTLNELLKDFGPIAEDITSEAEVVDDELVHRFNGARDAIGKAQQAILDLQIKIGRR